MMVFDSARGRMVLHGQAGNAPTFDTWEYSAGVWVQVYAGSNGPRRSGSAMAYDPTRMRTVLFGGYDGVNSHAETWEWDGSTWSLRPVANPPPARFDHGMAFDPYGGGVMIFGGVTDPFFPTYLGDSYIWNGTSWVERTFHRTPSPRKGHRMVFSPALGRTVILSGYSGINLVDGWMYPGVMQAEVTSFGASCGNLSLSTTTPPVLGQVGQASLSRPTPFGLSYVAVGLSQYRFGPLTLPLPLDGYGLPGCFLHQDAALTAHGPTAPTSSNSASFSIALPNAPVLAGLSLYLQGWVPDFAANQGGLVASGGLRWVLGNF